MTKDKARESTQTDNEGKSWFKDSKSGFELSGHRPSGRFKTNTQIDVPILIE